MKTFEIHITGSENINDALSKLGIKNIVVELLDPDNNIIRMEHMSSFVEQHEDDMDCYKRVMDLCDKLRHENVEIYRYKIETPYYEEYVGRSLYMESHFKPNNNKYPMSRNVLSGKLMGTDRTYNKNEYPTFMDKW